MTADGDLERLLKSEDAEYAKDAEIERILNCFKLDAYSVLDTQPGCTTQDIRNIYRRKSRLIHPDKTKNERAPEAFDRLKKAESELMDDKLRERLDQCFAVARQMLLRERRWSTSHPELQTPEFLGDVRRRTREVLIEDELDRRRAKAAQMREEGRERAEQDARAAERKRKREHEKSWEATRDQRVGGWRKFTKQAAQIGDSQRPVPPPPPPPPPPAGGSDSRSPTTTSPGSASPTVTRGIPAKKKKPKIRLLG